MENFSIYWEKSAKKLKFLKIHQNLNYGPIFKNFVQKCSGDLGLSKIGKKKFFWKGLRGSKKAQNSKICFFTQNLEFWALFTHFRPTQKKFFAQFLKTLDFTNVLVPTFWKSNKNWLSNSNSSKTFNFSGFPDFSYIGVAGFEGSL